MLAGLSLKDMFLKPAQWDRAGKLEYYSFEPTWTAGLCISALTNPHMLSGKVSWRLCAARPAVPTAVRSLQTLRPL